MFAQDLAPQSVELANSKANGNDLVSSDGRVFVDISVVSILVLVVVWLMVTRFHLPPSLEI